MLKELTCEEFKIPVQWGHIAGKWWGSQKIRPILITHGWQDHCGSFDRLIPLLPEQFSYLAIDYPGHGLSSPIPQGMFYHAIDNVILIQRLMKHFGWNKVSLMGHSFGAVLNFVYTSMFPDSVEVLICIDGMSPLAYLIEQGPISQKLQDFLKYDALVNLKMEPPIYSEDELIKKLYENAQGTLSLDSCRCLLKRNIVRSTKDLKKFYFKRDQRIKATYIAWFPPQQIIDRIKTINCPVFVCSMTRTKFFERTHFKITSDVINEHNGGRCEYHIIEGFHHAHLDEPEKLAGLLGNFLKKYHHVTDSNENKMELKSSL